MTNPELARLLKYTRRNDATGCLEWTRCKTTNGYGYAWDPTLKRKERVHRLVYRLAHGDVPPGGYVCHRCDNPICINPDHLWLGDAKTNMVDKKVKGRAPSQKGEQHGRSKLREEDIDEIIALKVFGLSDRKIAKRFGVTGNAIRKIICGEAWSHVPRVLTWTFHGDSLVKQDKRAA